MSDWATHDDARAKALAELLGYVPAEHREKATAAYVRAEQAAVDGAHLRWLARQSSTPPRAGFQPPGRPR
jgi:hypothetical protein